MKHRQLLRFFSFRRIAIPVGIGLAVAVFLLFRDFNPDIFRDIQWADYMPLWIFLVIILMVLRHVAYMYRIRLLTDGQITWRKSFQVIILWEFASSLTPSVVGGTAVALFIVRKEGINMGRTTAVVMTTALLDELFYILMVPLVFLMAGMQSLFIETNFLSIGGLTMNSRLVFWIGYIFIIFLTTIILFGIFINPHGLKKVLTFIFRFRWLRRWKAAAEQTGDEVIVTSAEMRGKPFSFWAKAFLSTVVSWTARFLTVNVLIMMFVPVTEHFLIFARQLIMWVILLISPTPGSSGVAEYFFPVFLGEFTGQALSMPIAILWRLLSYYPYIFLGVIVLPHWIRRVYFGNRRAIRFRKPDQPQ